MNDPRPRRVVLVPFPLQGHLTPMLQLGTILHAQGFSITVLHPEYNSPNSSNHPEFTFLPLSDDLSGKDSLYSSPFQFVSDMNSSCRIPLQERVANLMELHELQGRVACVIHDSIMDIAESVATAFDLPSIILRTSSAANLLSYGAILQLNEQNLIPLPVSQLENPVPSLESLRFKDLPFPVSAEIPQDVLELLQSIDNITCIGSDKRAVILNSSESLEEGEELKLQKRYQVPFFSIGPFHKMAQSHNPTSLKKEDVSCMKWLDEQAPNSVIYVSLGSLATIDREEVIETAWGLVESKQPFLWVIRSNLINGSVWNECFPDELAEMIEERGRIVEWSPQREILAHPAVGAFLSHCGWNSTLESISEGVPMLCRPWLADQYVNTRYISHAWRVGIELENARDRTIVKNSIKRLMAADEEGKEIRERCIDLKRKLKVSVHKGGSSYESLENLTKFILSL